MEYEDKFWPMKRNAHELCRAGVRVAGKENVSSCFNVNNDLRQWCETSP